MNDLVSKLLTLWPEMTLAIGACFCLLTGLWPARGVRRAVPAVAMVSLLVSGGLLLRQGMPETIAGLVKLATIGVGLLLLAVAASLPKAHPVTAWADDPGRNRFEPGHAFGGEFFAFFLLSLTGVMLTASANDLVWLFLALELTSLPTYIMIAISRPRPAALESAIKYFFLGALAAAFFLYGFTMLYGASGTTSLKGLTLFVAQTQAAGQPLPAMFMLGLAMSIAGLAFKIAAVPMHFYVADVYQGAASTITAFLAFVPKTAGFAALMLILGVADPSGKGQLPPTLIWVIAALAILTMTVGNVLGLLQTSVKRILAYSSVAHSGYMLLGILCGIGPSKADSALGNGLAAVLFYLVGYGLATLAAFAVLGSLRCGREEVDRLQDLGGLSKRHPVLAAIMLLSLLSLIGLPPLVGFSGKVYLFGTAIQQGYLGLVIVAVINSAISATYYLKIASACYFGQPTGELSSAHSPLRVAGAALAVALALLLGVAGQPLVAAAQKAASARPVSSLLPVAITQAVPETPQSSAAVR